MTLSKTARMPALAAAVLASTVGGTFLGMSQTNSNGQHSEITSEQPGVTQLHPGQPVKINTPAPVTQPITSPASAPSMTSPASVPPPVAAPAYSPPPVEPAAQPVVDEEQRLAEQAAKLQMDAALMQSTAADLLKQKEAVAARKAAALQMKITAQEATRIAVVANPNTDPVDPNSDQWDKYVGQMVVVEFRTTATLSGLNSVVGPSPFAYDNKPDVGMTWAAGILAAADGDKVSLVLGPYKDEKGRIAWRHTMSIPAETVFDVSMIADLTK